MDKIRDVLTENGNQALVYNDNFSLLSNTLTTLEAIPDWLWGIIGIIGIIITIYLGYTYACSFQVFDFAYEAGRCSRSCVIKLHIIDIERLLASNKYARTKFDL
jgi:hypothetical protein